MSDEADAPTSVVDVDRDAISRVAKRVEIRRIRLDFCHLEINAESPEILVSHWPTAAFLVWNAHLAERDGSSTFSAHADFLARMKRGVNPDNDPLPDYEPEDLPDVEIAAGFLIEYALAPGEDVTDHDLEHFCFFNGTHNAWSYWRELVQSACTRMGIEPLTVPVLPVPRMD